MTPPSLFFPLAFLILVAAACSVVAWFYVLDSFDLPERSAERATALRDALLAAVAASCAAVSAYVVALALPV